MTDEHIDQIQKSIEMLLKLRILEMLERGYSQAQLAKVLGMSQPTISRMVPKVSPKKG